MPHHDIRAAILAEMKRLDCNPNQLAVAVKPHVSRSQVYDFLNGKSDLGTEKVRPILAALGLRVVK